VNSRIHASGFPEEDVRARAREGSAQAFPSRADYGSELYGASGCSSQGSALMPRDVLEDLRLTPPVFMPGRLEKLIELGREPHHTDVATGADVGGFRSPLPVYVSAFGSTEAITGELCRAVSTQAGRMGIPMVIGENITTSLGYRRTDHGAERALRARVDAYCAQLPDGLGGIAIQQSTADADAEVWNAVYCDPEVEPLLASGRLAFELKVGQGAKPGLGGMTVVPARDAAALAAHFELAPVFGEGADRVLRCTGPGTFTEEILRQQVRLMRNNYPRARVWVKLHPGRDVGFAARVAWEAGADAVTVDGAEGGSGWAPLAAVEHAGLPLGECLLRIGDPGGHCLLASGRMWDGARAVKALALGARAVGLGRAAIIAADEDPDLGLVRLVDCFGLEFKLLLSALGKYDVGRIGREDVWPLPAPLAPAGSES
jgi:methylamine---glutamate N-methyltransferase subunit C